MQICRKCDTNCHPAAPLKLPAQLSASLVIDELPLFPTRQPIDTMRDLMTALQDMNDRYAVYRQVIGDQGAMAIPGESFGAQNGGSLLRGAARDRVA